MHGLIRGTQAVKGKNEAFIHTFQLFVSTYLFSTSLGFSMMLSKSYWYPASQRPSTNESILRPFFFGGGWPVEKE